MKFARSAFVFACLFVASSAFGQRFTTVQLPTYQVFSINTTVSVPDRGAVYLGGVNRSASGSTRRGGLLNSSRGFGSGSAASGVSVSAYIHDFEAMDKAVLAEAYARRARRNASTTATAATGLSLDSRSIQTRAPRVSDQRKLATSQETARVKRAYNDFALAKRLLTKGKTGAARIMLRNARQNGDENLQVQIEETLASLSSPAPRLANR